jgi:hypothetical protein
VLQIEEILRGFGVIILISFILVGWLMAEVCAFFYAEW